MFKCWPVKHFGGDVSHGTSKGSSSDNILGRKWCFVAQLVGLKINLTNIYGPDMDETPPRKVGYSQEEYQTNWTMDFSSVNIAIQIHKQWLRLIQ